MNHAKLIENLIAKHHPDALTDAFEACRELETENSVVVHGTGKRDYGTTIYDDDNFALAHDFSKKIRIETTHFIKENNAPDLML